MEAGVAATASPSNNDGSCAGVPSGGVDGDGLCPAAELTAETEAAAASTLDDGSSTGGADGFGCSVSELPLDREAQQRFDELAQSAAAPLRRIAADHDAIYGRHIASMLAWNRIEHVAMWAVGSTKGIDSFINEMPRVCA
eukprot:COSAG01_NODE_695_length_14201_cov_10.521875_3_plen_140_part_00